MIVRQTPETARLAPISRRRPELRAVADRPGARRPARTAPGPRSAGHALDNNSRKHPFLYPSQDQVAAALRLASSPPGGRPRPGSGSLRPPSGPGAARPPIRSGAQSTIDPVVEAGSSRSSRAPRRPLRRARSGCRARRGRRARRRARRRADRTTTAPSAPPAACAALPIGRFSVYQHRPLHLEEPRLGRSAQAAVQHHPHVGPAARPSRRSRRGIVGERPCRCRRGSRRAPPAAPEPQRRPAGEEIHWLSPVAVAMRPSRLIAHLRVTAGRPQRGGDQEAQVEADRLVGQDPGLHLHAGRAQPREAAGRRRAGRDRGGRPRRGRSRPPAPRRRRAACGRGGSRAPG